MNFLFAAGHYFKLKKKPIAVYCAKTNTTNQAITNRAKKYADFLNTEIIDDIIDNIKNKYEFILRVEENNLYLQYLPNSNFKFIQIDFNDKKLLYRLKFGGRYKEDIAKACKVKTNNLPTILDTTAGFGVDAFILASLGCEITLLEREPVIYLMLQNALQCAQHNFTQKNIAKKINLLNFDSITYLRENIDAKKFSVIYIDNMFPPRPKSAKIKKEMYILQMLLQNKEDDTNILFDYALRCAQNRVVIKRPKFAPFINQQQPDITFSGKSCRYDVYLTDLGKTCL